MADAAGESNPTPELTANGVAAKVATNGEAKTAVGSAAAEDVTASHGDVKTTIGKSGDSVAEVSPTANEPAGDKPVTKEGVTPMDVDSGASTVEVSAAETKETSGQQQSDQDAMAVDKSSKKGEHESKPSAEGKEAASGGASGDSEKKTEKEDKEIVKKKDPAKAEENGGDGDEDGHDEGKEEVKSSSGGRKNRKRKSSSGSSPLRSPMSPERTRPTRERKRAERYEVEDRRDKHETPVEIKQGMGTAFKDIPNVAYKIGKKSRADDLLHMLHVLLFRRRAKQQTVKANVLQFSGYVWDNEEKDKTAVKERLDRYTKEGLNQLLDLLDLQKGGKKEEQVHRIIQFLETPHKTTDSILEDKDKKGKKRKSTGSRGRPPKRAKKEGKVKKGGKSKDTTTDGEEDGEGDDDDDTEDKSGLEDETEGKKGKKLKEKSDGESDDGEDKEDSDEEDKEGAASDEEEKVSSGKGKKEGKKGSAKKSTTPAKAKKQTPRKRTPKKESSKKSPKRSTPKEKKSVKWKDGASEEVSKSGGKGKGKGSDSPSEKSKGSSPRVSSPSDKVMKGQPTEEDLKEKITELLNGADLKKVSLKNVREQLEKHFKCDLDSRKKSIKEIVYDVIPEDSDE